MWHNLVLCGGAYLLLRFQSTVFSPLYYTASHGLEITYVAPHASISGESGLSLGDRMLSINDCDLTRSSLVNCLVQTRNATQIGFCDQIELDQFHPLSEECCHGENATHLCFTLANEETSACMRARQVIESSTEFCRAETECSSDARCVIPVVNASQNERLLVIRHVGAKVLFLGDPYELIQ